MSLILIIDDESSILELFEGILGDEGHATLRARDGRMAMALLDERIDLVITDLVMPNQEGLETIIDIRRRGYDVPVIAMSGGGAVGPHAYLETARLMGANAVLAKPFSRGEVLTVVRSMLALAPA